MDRNHASYEALMALHEARREAMRNAMAAIRQEQRLRGRRRRLRLPVRLPAPARQIGAYLNRGLSRRPRPAAPAS